MLELRGSDMGMASAVIAPAMLAIGLGSSDSAVTITITFDSLWWWLMLVPAIAIAGIMVAAFVAWVRRL
jgi:hypothetical protein